jgi:tyrosine-protein phosphatase SIW14
MQKRVGMVMLLGVAMLLVVLQAEAGVARPAASHRDDHYPRQGRPRHRLSYGATVPRAHPSQALLPNFHYVDDHVYRGAQPAPNGWNALANLGVKLVIDLRRDGELREHWTRSEQKAVEAVGMRYVNVPMNGWVAPDNKQILRIIATLESGQRVFVHCRAGKDRTGTVIACYRIGHDHWTRKRALSEAASLGMSPRKAAMQHYILGFRP